MTKDVKSRSRGRLRLSRALSGGLLTLCGVMTPLALATNGPTTVAPVLLGPPPVYSNLPPTASTNVLPPVTSPLPAPKPTPAGASALPLFGTAGPGKFGISGRSLALPAHTNAPVSPHAWRRQIDFGLSLTQGNSDTLRYTAAVDALHDTERKLIRLRAFGAGGESEGETDTENAGASERSEWKLTEAWYALQTVDLWHDSIADIDYRVTMIASPGYHVVDTERVLVNVEAGAGYIQERKAEEEEGFAAARLAVAVERVLNPYVMGWCSAEYLPRLEDPGIYYVNAEAGVSSALPPRMALNVVIRERYDSQPTEGNEASDLALTVSLSAKF